MTAMTESQVARILIEQGGDKRIDPKVRVLLNRMMVQIASAPSLQTYLVDAGIVPQDDGSASLQFDFLRLPEEVIPQVEKLMSASSFDSFKWSRYVKNGQAHVGLDLRINPENLPGTAYDYAY